MENLQETSVNETVENQADELFDDGFADGLADEIDLGDQQDEHAQTGGDGADDAENQRMESQAESAGEKEGGAEGRPSAESEQAGQFVQLRYNGREIGLPAAAVEQLQAAIGENPIALLQKGMNYEQKGEHELWILDEYARESGMSRGEYLAALENQMQQVRIRQQVERARAEFPETPEAALLEIAKSRMQSEQAARQKSQADRLAQIRAMTDQIRQKAEGAERAHRLNEWNRYAQIVQLKRKEDVPPELVALVKQENISPVEAHYRLEAQRAAEIQKKQEQNRRESPGSMAGAADVPDDFLQGLFG